MAAHQRALELAVTILRPMAFMELMTERRFFPPASTWHLMPKLMGATRPVGWLTVEDLAVIAAKAFGDPARFIGRDLPLTSDVLWRWLRANEIDLDTAPTLAIHPEALTVREWLRRKKTTGVPGRPGRTSAQCRYALIVWQGCDTIQSAVCGLRLRLRPLPKAAPVGGRRSAVAPR